MSVALPEVPVDEVLHVAQLEFDGRADIVEADDARIGRDDVEAALHAARMVVGELQDEEIFEDVAVHMHLQGRMMRPGPPGRLTACVGTIAPQLK